MITTPETEWLTLRDGSKLRRSLVTLLLQQPDGRAWIFQGPERIRTEQPAEEIAETLGSEWKAIPCKVARGGTSQGKPYWAWTRPQDVKRVMLHSSGRITFIVHASGRVMFTTLKPEEVVEAITSEVHALAGSAADVMRLPKDFEWPSNAEIDYLNSKTIE